MNRKFRFAGWLAVAGLLGAALLLPSSALATDLHVSHQGTAWNAQGFKGDCAGVDLAPGEVAWHFVLTSPDKDSGHLTATFDKAGDVTVANSDSPAAVLHFWIITGHDTLLDAKTTDVDGGLLNLSHICVGRETESAPVETNEPSSKVETQEPSQDVETSEPSQDVETQEPSQDVETSTPSQDTETSTPCADCTPATHSVPTPTPCVTCVPSTHSVPSGSVDGATGTPDEGVTPPATDTLTPSNTTASNDGWQLVLIALAALISTALILTPATRKARR